MHALWSKFWMLAGGSPTRRMEAEEALRVAEEKYRRIFEDSLEGLYQTSADGQFISANPALARMLGYATPQELTAKRTDIGRQGYVRPERREEFKRLMAERGTVRGFEYEVWRKDGTTIWVSENARAVRAADGTLRYYEGSMTDITEHKQAEAELRVKQGQLVEALRIARLAYWEYDVLNDLFHFNDQFYSILRTTAQAQGGYSMSAETYARRFVYPDDMALVGQEIGRALAATDPDFSRELDHRVIFGDGEIGHIAVHIRIEKDVTGRTIRTHGANMDITERKRAELKFRELFESAPDALLLLTPEGAITDVNLRAVELFGFAREEMIGRPASLLIPTELQPVFLERLAVHAARVAPEPQGSKDAGLKACAKDGRVFPIDISLSPLRSGMGELVIAAVRDTTAQHRAIEQQRALESQLRQSQKTEALGTLAGGIAHDFNNLLTAIIGHSELALGDLPARHPAVANLKAVRQAGLRSRDLVRQILLFSRRTETTRAPIRLQNVIEESFILLRSTIPAMVEIERRVDPRCLPIHGDANQIHQVLMNLCTNAWHALPATGGRIELRLEMMRVEEGAGENPAKLMAGNYVQLTVTDNGHGMDAATLERIYDPFFTTKPVGKGTGLGLSMVHGIVKTHGGGIFVQSMPGHGTSFRICFPAVFVEADAVAEHTREIQRGQKERILYVDDDELASGALTALLGRIGYRVRHEALPANALTLFRSAPQDYDVVLTDLAMPGMPGSELAAQILRIRPDIPVVLISGFVEEMTSDAARAIGVREVVRKPVSPEVLSAAVRRALVAK